MNNENKRAGEINPVLRDWISVKERLPELTEPFMMYDDDNVRKVAWENDHVFVLAFDPERGIIKAKRDKRGWSEVSTNSISGCVTITHWQHLPGKPGDTILDLRKAEKAVATLTKERDELKSKVDNKVTPIREPELIPSESNAYVTMADGSRSRTLGELFQLIPQVHRKQIMGATGPGTSLCAVLEYVTRYGEEIRSQCNQQREEVKEELEQVKLSFHQAVEEVKRLTTQVSGK